MKELLLPIVFAFTLSNIYGQSACLNLSNPSDNVLQVDLVATEDFSNEPIFQVLYTLEWDRGLGIDAFGGASGGSPIVAETTGNIRTKSTTFEQDFLFFSFLNVPEISLNNGGSTTITTINIDPSLGGTFAIFGEDIVSSVNGSIMNFGGGCTTSQPFTLPVELTTFTATPQSNSSILKWGTSSEFNNDYFSIEHSINGSEFVEIGQVGGAGTTTQTQNYSFTHANPTSGANYYRLKQVDFDEAFEYSEVEVVTFSNVTVENVKIFPNPADNFLVINAPQLSNLNVDLEVYDVKGKLLLHKNYDAFSTSQHLEINELPAGQYFIKLETDNQSLIERFTITR